MLIIIQRINILSSCIYLQILDYNTKNKYPNYLYILQNPDYNTRINILTICIYPRMLIIIQYDVHMRASTFRFQHLVL